MLKALKSSWMGYRCEPFVQTTRIIKPIFLSKFLDPVSLTISGLTFLTGCCSIVSVQTMLSCVCHILTINPCGYNHFALQAASFPENGNQSGSSGMLTVIFCFLFMPFSFTHPATLVKDPFCN